MGIDTLQAAKTYGEKIGLKSIREAGTKDGWHYYHVFRKLPNGHKTGLPQIVKVNEMGQCLRVVNLTERMWAVEQEVLINNL